MRHYLFRKKALRVCFALLDAVLSCVPVQRRNFPVSVKRILVIKPDHLGDALLFTAVLPLIKKQYPSLEIDLLCGRWATVIYKNNPHIAKLYTANHFFLNRSGSRWFKLKQFWHDYWAILPVLKANRYDVIFCMRGFLGNFNLLGRLSQPKCLVGYGTSGFGPFCDIEIPWSESVHEAEHFFEILAPLSIPFTPITALKSELYPDESDYVYVNQLVGRYGLEANPFCVISPSTGDPDKTRLVSPSMWAKIIEKKLMQYPYVVISGVKNNFYGFEKTFELLSPEAKARVIDFSDQLAVHQLYILLSKAAEIIAIDSLPVHIASMVNASTVAFFGYEKRSVDLAELLRQWRPLRSDILCVTSKEAINDYIDKSCVV